MIRVVLAGYRGRTGAAVAAALREADGIELAAGAGRGDALRDVLRRSEAAVLVDFTDAAAAAANALAAAAAGVAPVVGTSGLTAARVDEIEAACAAAGVGGIVAPNFALGAVLMMWLAEAAAPHFEMAEIVEAHQAGKRDAPSGTALATARRLAGRRRFRRPLGADGALAGTRGEVDGVGVHSLRLEGVVADQQVVFGAAGQTLTIAHRTTSREAYGPGVVLAVRRVVESDRFYRGLEEMLGLPDLPPGPAGAAGTAG